MNTLKYIEQKYNLDYSRSMPIEIPRIGREAIAEWSLELGFKKGVEVGVAGGDFSLVLVGTNPQMHLYGVDPYRTHHDYKDYVYQQSLDDLEQRAHGSLDSYPNYEFIKKTSMEAVGMFEDESLDLVYLDGNHNFQNITNDIVEWQKKLKQGGILAGHDFIKYKKGWIDTHVKQVVCAFTDAYQISPWFVLGSADVTDLPRDNERSWAWVK